MTIINEGQSPFNPRLSAWDEATQRQIEQQIRATKIAGLHLQAAVVAGLANAFHPSQTTMDEKLCRAKAYLSDKALNREKWVVRRIA